MLKGAVAGRYSTALYDLASEAKAVDQVEEDLRAVVGAIETEGTFRQILYHPQIAAADKKELLDSIFKDKILPLTGNFVALLVDRRRETFIKDILDEFIVLANRDRNVVEARVSSAIELTNDEQSSIEQLLAKITGMKVLTSYAVEPSLMGGVLVHIGDKVIDGSIKARLATMSDNLKKIS